VLGRLRKSKTSMLGALRLGGKEKEGRGVGTGERKRAEEGWDLSYIRLIRPELRCAGEVH